MSSWSRSVTRWPRSHPVPRWPPGACSTLHIWADVGGVGADFVGIPGATGTLAAEKKPQIAGVFTDLEVAAQPGLSARIDVDTRFITSPTALKLAAMVLGVACVVASIAALAVLDPGAAQAATLGPSSGVHSPRVATVLAGRRGDLDRRRRRHRHAAAVACDRRHFV